jgi:hypothetical protein
MKRQILTLAAVLTLVFAGAAFAQTATAPDSAIQNHPTATNQDSSALETYPLDQNNAGTPETTAETTGTTGTTTTGTSADAVNADTADDATLPSTASDLPSLLLIGLLALGAAFGIHAYSTRRA